MWRAFTVFLIAACFVVLSSNDVDAKAASLTGERKLASATDAEAMVAACPKIAFIKRQRYGMHGTNGTMFARGTDVGSAICVYDPSTPEVEPETIFETTEGFIFNMNPSSEGDRLVFTYKERRDLPFHIWEIKTDGSGLRQITKGNFHDHSPVYYGDGRIVFCSSRVESFSLCQNFLACALYICDSDGTNIRRIDHTTLCTISPTILPNGSILCTRWEYQDKNIFGWQGLWTIHPNGRNLQLYHGNTFRVPNSVYGARPIPGTSKAVCVWAAHHHPPIGEIAVVDRSRGLETEDSMWKVTDVTPYKKDVATRDKWRITGIGGNNADTIYPESFCDPFPFSKEYTLVSFAGDTAPFHSLCVLNHETGDTATLLALDRAGCFSAVPLNERPKPRIIPGEVPVEKGFGCFYCQDVYQGLTQQGVKRGQVKSLRIFAQSPKKYNTEGPRYHDHYPIVGQGTYYVKEYFGTVPVDENGSAFFVVPSNTELYFTAIDETGKEIQRMGSVTQITTGEHATCIGCHEDRLRPPPSSVTNFTRMRRPPDRIEPPAWGAGPVDYAKQVQPVLDRHCIKCHSGGNPPKGIDLSGDRARFYSMSYVSLVYKNYVEYYYINRGPNGNFPAMATGSWVSRLTKHLEDGHNKIKLSAEELDRIYTWIDANVPYYGTWDMTRPWTQGGRDLFGYSDPGRVEEATGKFIRGLAHKHPWVAKLQAVWQETGFPGKIEDDGMINFTRPELSPMLTQQLSQDAGGRAANDSARMKSIDDPRYQAILKILNEAKQTVDDNPPIEMQGAKALPQSRDFGRVY